MTKPPPETPISDEQLALRAAAGCLESFRLLVQRYQVPLVRYLSRWAARLQDAEDLAQDTFVKAHRYLSRFDPQWRFSTWLFMIGRRLSINAARRQHPVTLAADTAQGAPLTELVDEQPDPSQQLASQESRSELWSIAAEVLTREQFDALWMFYVQGFSIVETALVMDRTSMAVKSMLFRARQQLRPHLSSAAAASCSVASTPADEADETESDTLRSTEEWDYVRAYFTP